MIIHLKDLTKIVSEPKAIWNITKDLLKAEDLIDQDKEHLWVFHLNSRNQIKLIELVSLGILNSSLIHPREVFTRAVGERAAQIIIAHNHPSGEVTPSEDDLVITKRLVKAGEILGIELIDHLVVTAIGFTSFKKKGLI
jgi:DNA repair protein RadC